MKGADPLIRRRAFWDLGGAGASADAFGLMCVAYEQPMQTKERRSRPRGGGWMRA